MAHSSETINTHGNQISHLPKIEGKKRRYYVSINLINKTN